MHCHLDFLDDPAGFAHGARLRGLGFFSATVTPGGFERACELLAGCENVRVGVGLHPWWINDGRCDAEDVERVCAAIARTQFVGEIGLDFGKRCAASHEAQIAAFERIAAACAEVGGRLLTVHAVRSADAALDVLERTGCLANNQVILHWYSDTSEGLWRAVRAGCSISVNARMLVTRRGREYARVIPLERLLLETDLPPDDQAGFTLDAWEADLRGALGILEEIRGVRLGEALAQNSKRLLAF